MILNNLNRKEVVEGEKSEFFLISHLDLHIEKQSILVC